MTVNEDIRSTRARDSRAISSATALVEVTKSDFRVNMKRFCLVIVLALLAIVLPSQTGAVAQDPPIDNRLADQYFHEAQATCNRDGGKLWGRSLCAPLLFVDPATRTVVANQADKEGVLTRNGNVFVGKLPVKVNIANTAIEWSGVKWSMMIFQAVSEDKHRRAGLMTHESWHRIQNEIDFPSSGAANNHLDSRDGRIWLQLEWRALAAALTGRAKQRREAIADALLFRAYRRMVFPQAATEEREMEMHEGLAEYTGVKLSESPNLNKYVVDVNLKEAAQKQTFVRSFAYASGPAYGLLLDQTKGNWRKGLNKEDDLGILVQRRLGIKLPRDLKTTAEARSNNYDGVKLIAFETKREHDRQSILAAYRTQLVDGPLLTMPVQQMNMQMNPGNLVPLEPLGTVYPDLRVVDVWGILTARKGALIKSDFSKIYVSAPTSSTASPIQGDGWTLELNKGWALAAGERNGDFIVKKME